MVLGELGPLAVSVLPGFRSAAVVLKVCVGVFLFSFRVCVYGCVCRCAFFT
jgi:hypothetical protein